MVLGALLAYSAASYYAKQKGIEVENVLSWSICSCSSRTNDQVVDDIAFTTDYDLKLEKNSSTGSSHSARSTQSPIRST